MLRKLQDEQREWSQYNFGKSPSWMPFFGLVEELGELAHSHLKMAQGIRQNENHEAKAKDAVGDIVIFLSDYCNANGYDLEEIVRETWDSVKVRDWRKYPDTGMPAGSEK
jgi:NTP pyrophosphatase (non-canonical NTP hydrolase)